jgi:hypothetical protein
VKESLEVSFKEVVQKFLSFIKYTSVSVGRTEPMIVGIEARDETSGYLLNRILVPTIYD